MDMDSRLFVIIASRVPAIWDVIGPLALNPQPLPPVSRTEVYTELNPQPLPPGPPPETYGAVVGRELVRLQWQAEKLGQDVAPLADWEDDPCPTYPRKPTLPPWLPPVPDPNPAWLDGYYLGLACALAVGGAGARESAFMGEAFERALKALGGPDTGPAAS
jgi:hypothetical protein